MSSFSRFFCLGAAALLGLLAPVVHAEPVNFDIPPQTADKALLAFSKQAHTEVLFPFDEMHQANSGGVKGRLEPKAALDRLLEGTGFGARPNGNGRFVVTSNAQPTGTVKGKVINADGTGLRGIRVAVPETRQTETTDARGEFEFASVIPGKHHLVATATGYQSLQVGDVEVLPDQIVTVATLTLRPADEPSRLAPFLVAGQADEARPFALRRDSLPPRTAVGNVDLARTENDALPFTIHDRTQIRRSGVVNLNEFLQRELLDSAASRPPPEQDASTSAAASYTFGSSNLSLRGFDQTDETIILVNGRRLPEILTSGEGGPRMPDVNFIPLSLVQQIQVLPISASSLYSGNPVGGVINIVLRPEADANATELTTTYTNTLGGYDAPQSTVSLLHGRTLLGGKLHLRLNATVTRSEPATEAELDYHAKRARREPAPSLTTDIFRATPNVRSVDGSPLFGPGTSPVTSVAPGADGNGGLAAFASRDGVRNLAFFDAPGGLANSIDSSDFPYGRRQSRNAYFMSAVYDVSPRLQLGLDATYATTSINRGYDVLRAPLLLGAASPFNPFKQDVIVSVNETAVDLGEGYSEARLEYGSTVLGALMKFSDSWRVSADAQYARNVTKYRGLSPYGATDNERWQNLVDTGRYNPLRDTQVFGPPPDFYREVLKYRGDRGRSVTLGDYDTLDAAFRLTNDSLPLPTGRGIFNFGGDYRRNHLAAYHELSRFGDGTTADTPQDWDSRTIQRYSVFAELQAPLVPERRRPSWLRSAEADLAVRYIAANSSRESYTSPTLALKFEFPAGFIARGSVTTSNRFPTPQLNRQVFAPSTEPGSLPRFSVTDPRRNERYDVPALVDPTPNLVTESALTQTAGVVFQHGKVHRIRAALDYVDTRKTDEQVGLAPQDILNVEAFLPDRVIRDASAPGDPNSVGRVSYILYGATNLSGRRSQNWNGSFDYVWTECFGGSLSLYSRFIYYERYKIQLLPTSPYVDELRHPDTNTGVLRYRTNFGASWSTPHLGFGVDGHYFHSRVIPQPEWLGQGHDRIRPHWQFDTFMQGDLGHLLPGKLQQYGLTAQLRINNVLNTPFPKYVNDPSGAGVQPYGDWRGRVLSLSLTATF